MAVLCLLWSMTSEQLMSFLQVACGARHTIILDDQGQAFSCGWNKFGQLGRTSDTVAPELQPMMLPEGIEAISMVFCGWWSSLICVDI